MADSNQNIPTLIERFYHWEKTTPDKVFLVNLSEIGIAGDPADVEKSVLDTVNQVNKTRANYERISTVIIQRESWSIENDLLTPTLKVKRGKIDERFGGDYLPWHETDGKVLWV